MLTGKATIIGNGSFSLYILPTPPTNITATNIGTTSATINFTAPPAAQGITSYNAYNNGALLGNFTGTSSFTLTPLNAITSYVITLVSINAYGKSQPSSSVSFTTQSTTAQLEALMLQLYKFNTGDKGGGNNTFYNYATNNNGYGYLTGGGSGVLSTSQYKYGNASWYCPATNGGIIQAIYGGTNASYYGDGNFKSFPTTGFTSSMWLYPTETPTGGNAPLYMLYVQKSNTIVFTVSINSTSEKIVVSARDTTGNVVSLTSNTAISHNVWTNVAVSVSTSNEYTIYINGTSDSSVTSTVYPSNVGCMPTIGSGYGFLGYFGYIDQVITFNSCLSQSTIQNSVMTYSG